MSVTGYLLNPTLCLCLMCMTKKGLIKLSFDEADASNGQGQLFLPPISLSIHLVRRTDPLSRSKTRKWIFKNNLAFNKNSVPNKRRTLTWILTCNYITFSAVILPFLDPVKVLREWIPIIWCCCSGGINWAKMDKHKTRLLSLNSCSSFYRSKEGGREEEREREITLL